MNSPDEYVLHYQSTKDAAPLLAQYEQFLNKYYQLLAKQVIDYHNYDIRCFIACYIKEEETIKDLRASGHYKKQTMESAQLVVQQLHSKIRSYQSKEIYHELVIPFLQIASIYQPIGVGFEKYAYKTYKYHLKRHLDEIKWDVLDSRNLLYLDEKDEEHWEEEIEVIDALSYQERPMSDLLAPDWIHGDLAEAPFDQLSSHERFVLVRYYDEGWTDKEIARKLPYHPKSIHRMRARIVKTFHELVDQKVIKHIRWKTTNVPSTPITLEVS